MEAQAHPVAATAEHHAGPGVPGMRDLERVVEAIVFATDEPVPAVRIAAVFAEVTGADAPSEGEVEAAVERLNAGYVQSGGALRVQSWAGGYRMATDASMAPFLKTYFREPRRRQLSRSLMETLAIVAYRQPTTKPEIDFVRGVDSDYALRKLLETGLVDVVGRSESLGRPLLYGTTPRFLEQFGLNRLEELPTLREIEEILDDPAFNRERARLLELQEEDDLNRTAQAAPDDRAEPPAADRRESPGAEGAHSDQARTTEA